MIQNSEECLIPYSVHAAIQRNFKGLEKWAERHLMLSKGKCKVLHLSKNNPMHQSMLEANWLVRQPSDMDLGILFNKFNMSKQGTLVAKKAISLPELH